jgi:hypothetical protein
VESFAIFIDPNCILKNILNAIFGQKHLLFVIPLQSQKFAKNYIMANNVIII